MFLLYLYTFRGDLFNNIIKRAVDLLHEPLTNVEAPNYAT